MKRVMKNMSPQLIYQAALECGLESTIESSRFNLFSVVIDGKKFFIRGTRLPVNAQSSCSVASNKYLSKKVFKNNGIQVPESWLVATVKEARETIVSKNLFPCVLKPITGSHGDKIFANIESLEELDSILSEFSKTHHKSILIERHIDGIDLRVLVVGDSVSAVIERIPAHVVGDGKSTIRQLIKIFNAQPLVGKKYEKPLCKIHINFELMRSIRKRDLKITSVIPKGEKITLKQTANISVGGVSKDVTDSIGSSVKSVAVKAAQAVGLEFCGVDIMYNPTTGESRVLEVNDCPGIDIHHYPVIGDEQNVARDIVEYMIERNTNASDSVEQYTYTSLALLKV